MVRLFFNYMIILFASAILPAGILCAQPGQYAGSMKKIIGASYIYSDSIPGLKTWTFNQGSLLSAFDDPEIISATVYKKGTTLLVFISIGKEDAATDSQNIPRMKVIDVMEIKNVARGQEIKTAVCRQNNKEDQWILALIKPAAVDYSKALKAWRFNRDKRKLQVISIKGVDCMNEGFEQF
jgi:hypothetical protein